jgi:hypothetical protein
MFSIQNCTPTGECFSDFVVILFVSSPNRTRSWSEIKKKAESEITVPVAGFTAPASTFCMPLFTHIPIHGSIFKRF